MAAAGAAGAGAVVAGAVIIVGALAALGALAAPLTQAGASPHARPPAAVQQAAAVLGCASIAWGTWRGGWWADCASTDVSARDGGGVALHRYVAFRRLTDGQFAMEPITETRATSSPRAKSPRTETVVLRDARVTYEARTEAGDLHRRIWDLAANPARLVEERDGGGKICRDGFANHTSDVVRRSCITDYAAHRQRCTAPQPSCRREPIAIATPSYTAIPVHAAGAPLRDADLFACATEIGGRPEDLITGKNPGRAAFRVVAVDDAAAATLTLHLRASDATPQPAGDDGWQLRDHWELWLAGPRSELACDDTADLAGYCQRNPAAAEAIAIAIAPHRDGALQVAAAAGAPPASWSSDLHARRGDRDAIVELTGALRDWAREGAITIVYSDSLRGTRQDAILATSSVRADRPETLGRLGDTLLCDRPSPPAH